MSTSYNRVEISRQALLHNFRVCRKFAGDAAVMAMVKADGYGHGMVECALLFALEGAASFGVAEAGEGVALRRAGITQPVLVFTGIVRELIPDFLEYDLTPVLNNGRLVEELSRQALRRNRPLDVHVKIDAGMGRQGCLPAEFPGLVRLIGNHPGIRLKGVMAHFPMADEPDSENTFNVFELFRETVKFAGLDNIDQCCFHIANSGGLFYFGGTQLRMVRPGIALYGYYPDGSRGRQACREEMLQPAMRFVTRIIQLRDVPAGTGLGYGHSHITGKETRLAVLPVGYAAGYLRSVGGKARVLINGSRFPVVGRISMNLTLVDLGDNRDIREGDEVVLLGRQGESEIDADEIASWMGTISYEVLCLFGNLNQRHYIA